MEHLLFMLSVLPVLVLSISISSNGNSPQIKMIGGMMVDIQKGFTPTTSKSAEIPLHPVNKKNKVNINSTNLTINERYRRLIPYMTFYYANDLAPPTTENYSTKGVEVEKVHLVETTLPERTAKKIIHPSYQNIPRYHGNRLTQYNIASSNPGRIYKEPSQSYDVPVKVTPNYNPLYDPKYYFGRQTPKPANQEITFPSQLRRPSLNLYHHNDNANIRYYLSGKEPAHNFKLVPYEQTPPVKIIQDNGNIYENYKKPSSLPVQDYRKTIPARYQPHYDNTYIQQSAYRKPPAIVSENYYETSRRPQNFNINPIVEGGFKPIIREPNTATTIAPSYKPTVTEAPEVFYAYDKQETPVLETSSAAPEKPNSIRPNYYQYVVEQSTSQPEYISNTLTLSDLLHSLQKTESIPKEINRDNVESSIKTLLQALNAIRVAPFQHETESPVLSTPKPFEATEKVVEIPTKQVDEPVSEHHNEEVEFSQEPYLAPVDPPSQHLDEFSDYRGNGGSTQRFPLQVTSDDNGGTPGKAGVDYPTLTIIPPTSFDCKTQRYKGFFADPETRCQVWHYCDLNGGQASFLCPNGTIFSQAALTCDWWFNVRCSSTAQLYVLNESLYKYILPHSPKFPEDYSGPLVDKYLTLKFKEMEEQFKKNKNKQLAASDKVDSAEESDSEEENITTEVNEISQDSSESSTNSESNIVIENHGTSGNVERLEA